MMHSTRLLPLFFTATVVVTFSTIAFAQTASVDRTTCYFPLSVDSSQSDTLQRRPTTPDQLYPDASLGWKHYLRLWKDLQKDPANESLRRYLGFATSKTPASKTPSSKTPTSKTNDQDVRIRRGRSAPAWLAWKPGSYRQVETSHFTIYSRADRQVSTNVARSLEQCYWVWTQMFFPLWEAAPQVSGHLERLKADQSLDSFLQLSSKRITIRRRLTVVLFSDAQQYVDALGKDNPGISQSTGFYSDNRRTTFLIGQPLDLPTLRHELVHQLFREATRSGLDEQSERDFWLVEGIAGYFESFSGQADGSVTLGGWDSPRLQFARYRVLANRDTMPIEELRRDGRLSAQSRTDLPRWYAHAIARTHQLLDGGNSESRKWIYQKLAELYKIDAGLGVPNNTIPIDKPLTNFLKVSDADLKSNPPTRSLTKLCLTRCDLTSAGLATLPVSDRLNWLDLSYVPIKNSDVARLLPQPQSLQQLSLEATGVDDEMSDWLRRAKALREVDLSWTQTGDQVIESLSNAKSISTLWMTGSKVSDASVDAISQMRNLNSVDLQRTDVSESGLSRLQAARNSLTVNPLQLISQ
ncbi:hypothetical protein LF1_43490 [Rubripirellula obstinata]|uniref:Leucine Rich repeats (2 copies) n=1 Tax=Rubripirellula obstinata TaxID=406547 RepID=A0A5B1CPK4_9BACT|nr:hypothetical protein [Rubripirellula obstinata]KAA1261789.1 hypothetical protein LF1_43490 [Rubripirellula obstinata]